MGSPVDDALDRLASRTWVDYGYEHMGDMWRDMEPLCRDVLALVEIAKAAREVSRIEATGTLPDFMPLAQALARLDSGAAEGDA